MKEDFAKKAVRESIEKTLGGVSLETLGDAFTKTMEERFDAIIGSAAESAGMKEMDKLSAAVLFSGMADTFAEFVHGLLMIAFYEGFVAGRGVKND